MYTEKTEKYTGDEVLTRISTGAYSLFHLLKLKEEMDGQCQLRKRGLKVAAWTVGILGLLMAGLLIFFGMRSPMGVPWPFLIPFFAGIGAILAGILWYCRKSFVQKPKTEFEQALRQGYPGLDLEDEGSIQEYIWSLKNSHQELVARLCSWIQWKKAHREMLNPVEFFLIEVWRVLGVRMTGARASQMDYCIQMLREIGAEQEAENLQEYLEIRENLEDLQDEEEYEEALYALERLEEQISLGREEVEEQMYQYAIYHMEALRK